MTNIYMEYLTESEREELILEKEIDLINTDIDYLFTTYEAVDEEKKQGIITVIIKKINELLDRIRNDYIPKIKNKIKEIKTKLLSKQGKHYVYKKIIFIMDSQISAFGTFLSEYRKINLLTTPTALEDLSKCGQKLADSINGINYNGNKEEKVLISNKDINKYEDMAEKILSIALIIKHDIEDIEKERNKTNNTKILAITSNDFVDMIKVLNTISKNIESTSLSMFRCITIIRNDFDVEE